MTRGEAITILKDISWQMGSVKRWENIEAIDMAIEALKFAKHFDLLKGYQSLQEVVRCKDCKNRYESECPMYSNVFYIVDKTQDNGFCYRGEKDGE